MKAREGDLIKTKSNVVFDVKGLVHPPNKIIAFPRFIPPHMAPEKAKTAPTGKFTASMKGSSILKKAILT
jgi:predicted nucleotidyltransferase